MTPPKQCDVVVIGGGPAGSVAASQLAMDGYSVVLLEKAKHPRPTVGESLIPQFWKFTDLIGATEAIKSEGFIAKAGGLVLWNGQMRQAKFSDFGYTRPGLHVERDRFDLILLERTRANGAQVFEETAVTRVDGDLEAPIVRYRTKNDETGEIRASYVIDASCQSALLARQLGIREFDPDIRFMSLWGYYEGGQYLTVEGTVHPFANRREIRPGTIVSSIGDWGWVWHIIMREKISIGIVLPPDKLKAFKAVRDEPEAKFQGMVAATPLIGDLLRDAKFQGELFGIRDYAYKPVKLAVGNCYMIGDAAAFVDPIASAGVVFGMYAGFASAFSIASSLRKPARRDELRERFCKLYGDRLELFRLIALPSEAQGIQKAIDAASNVINTHSTSELRLMLLQAMITSRAEGLTTAFERLGLSRELAARTIPIPAIH